MDDKVKRNTKKSKKTELARAPGFRKKLMVVGLTCAAANAFGLSLKPIPIPEPLDLDEYVANRPAAIALGKALFWDMQVGSDGIQACASCHFHAGADNRTRNQINPGIKGGDFEFGNTSMGMPGLAEGAVTVDMELTAAHFPTHQVARTHDPADPLTNPGNIVRDYNDVISSQGVKLAQFFDIVPGQPVDLSTPLVDDVFTDGTNNLRRVEPRNAPSVINTVYNFFNFWDGRGNNIFNGKNPFGAGDPRPHLLTNASGTLATEELRLRQASLASVAVGPPLSDFEMSFVGRTWPKIGKKMLSLKPLGQQQVSSTDSVLGPLADTAAGTGLTQSYADLIQLAFPERYWNNASQIVTYDADGNPTIAPGAPATTSEYTQMEANFSFFFGIAVQMYQATLVSDDSKFDRVAEGLASFTPAEANGFVHFAVEGCIACHFDPIMTDGDVVTTQGEQEPFPGFFVPTPLDQNPADANDFMPLLTGTAMYDTGTHNTGVRPGGNHTVGAFDYLAVSEDPARAAFTEIGDNQMEVPLSIGAISLWDHANTTPTPIPNTPELWGVNPPYTDTTVPGHMAAYIPELPPAFINEDTLPYAGRVNNGGAFKTANLRNVSLTGPYMHNGGMSTLRQVVDFYVRGADFPATNADNFDVTIVPLGAIRDQDVLVDELVQFLLTLTDQRVANEAAPFDHPEIFVPITGSADHPGGINGAVRTALVGDPGFQQVPAIGSAGRPGVFQPPIQPFLGLNPRDPALPVDADQDLHVDSTDNCTVVGNPDQRDTDGDGFGNMCDADLDNSQTVDLADFSLFRAAFGQSPVDEDADFNGDGAVDLADFSIFRGMFGNPPGPSAP